MRKFHSIAALRGDGLRPELEALFDQLAVDSRPELFARPDGMVQSGPDPGHLSGDAVFTDRRPITKVEIAVAGRLFSGPDLGR
jgi:hypothetical protein